MFFISGAVQANWVVRIPAVQAKLQLSTGDLGIALLGMPVGLLLAMPLTTWASARFGTKAVTRASASCYCLLLALPALAPSLWLLLAALFLFGVAAGTLDVAMNAQGVVVEREYGKSVLSSFHGFFSLGGLVGAGIGGAIASFGIALLPHLLGMGILLAIAALAASPWLLSRRPQGAANIAPGPIFVLPPPALFALGAVAFCSLFGEGAVVDWSAVYLKAGGAGAGVAALGFAAFSLTMAAGRFVGDWLNFRLGSVRLLRLGGRVAAFGLLLALLTSQPAVTIFGFACVGLGLSVIFPLVVSAAGRDKSMPESSAIAAVTTLGYLAFFVGPPVIGFTAELFTLRSALLIVVGLSITIVVLARAGR
jgi:MFS family permease